MVYQADRLFFVKNVAYQTEGLEQQGIV
jgi:hypothetical protein